MLKRYDEIGGPNTLEHYRWLGPEPALPLKWVKQVAFLLPFQLPVNYYY